MFPESFCTIVVLSLYGEHVVHFFLPEEGVYYLVTTGEVFE